MDDASARLTEATEAFAARLDAVDVSRRLTLDEAADIGEHGLAVEQALRAAGDAGEDASSPGVPEAYAVMERGKELLRSLEPPELYGTAYQSDAGTERRN